MKQQVRLVALLALMMLPVGVMGQVSIASDDASNYSTSNFVTEGNLGYGFGAWYSAVTTGGFYRGSATNNGATNSSIVNTGGNAFGMYAGGDGFADVGRNFTALSVGQAIEFDYSYQWDDGNFGFNLYTGGMNASQVFNFNINNNANAYTWTGGGSFSKTEWNSGSEQRQSGVVLHFVLRQTGTGLDYTITAPAGDGTFGTQTGSVAFAGSINALKFYVSNASGGGGDKFFNNLEIGSESASTSITNAAGWRLLSSPVSTTYADILAEGWTQGSTGADVTNGSANVRTYSTAGGFANVTDLGATAPAGQGFLYYHYNDDDYNGVVNDGPTTFSVTGSENASGTTFTPDWASGTQYAIAGNPFATTIDWDLVGKGEGVSETVWVYDRNISNYVSWNGTTGALTDGLIAPFQGFFFEYTSAASAVTFETADKSTGGTFYRKEVNPFVVALEGASGEFKSAAYIEFEESGEFGKGPKDALAFISLSPEHLTLSTVSDGKSYSINHLPMLRDELMLPLDLQFTEGGNVSLSTKQLNLPIGWSAFIRDESTGQVRELTSDFSMDVTQAAMKSAARNPLDLDGNPVMMAAATAPRFTLIVDPLGTTSTENGKQTTENFQLEQNYPNPFNPSTVVGFRLSVAGHATLKVYDVLGREVAVLVNGTLSAGSHSVNFDASNLTSGVYMYKLEAGGMVMTKRMTVVK